MLRVRISRSGEMVLPMDIRQRFGGVKRVAFTVDHDAQGAFIVLEPQQDNGGCLLCGSVVEVKQRVCLECAREAARR